MIGDILDDVRAILTAQQAAVWHTGALTLPNIIQHTHGLAVAPLCSLFAFVCLFQVLSSIGTYCGTLIDARVIGPPKESLTTFLFSNINSNQESSWKEQTHWKHRVPAGRS